MSLSPPAFLSSRKALEEIIESEVTIRLGVPYGSAKLRRVDVVYSPGESCIVSTNLDLGPPTDRNIAIVMTSPPPPEVVHRGTTLRSSHGRMFMAGGDKILLEEFPADYRLPGLTAATDPQEAAKLLSALGLEVTEAESLSTRVLRYRPHERCVIRYDTLSGPVAVGKLYASRAEAQRAWDTMRRLSNQTSSDHLVVTPLALADHAPLVVMEVVQGSNLADLMDATTDLKEMQQLADIAASSIWRFHQLKLEDAEFRTFSSEYAYLRNLMDSFAPSAPEFVNRLSHVLAAAQMQEA